MTCHVGLGLTLTYNLHRPPSSSTILAPAAVLKSLKLNSLSRQTTVAVWGLARSFPVCFSLVLEVHNSHQSVVTVQSHDTVWPAQYKLLYHFSEIFCFVIPGNWNKSLQQISSTGAELRPVMSVPSVESGDLQVKISNQYHQAVRRRRDMRTQISPRNYNIENLGNSFYQIVKSSTF